MRLEVGGRSYIFFFETTMIAKSITNTIVSESERLAFVDRLFGIRYVTKLEPAVFRSAESIAPAYNGAYWIPHSLGNGAFLWHPEEKRCLMSVVKTALRGTLARWAGYHGLPVRIQSFVV